MENGSDGEQRGGGRKEGEGLMRTANQPNQPPTGADKSSGEKSKAVAPRGGWGGCGWMFDIGLI